MRGSSREHVFLAVHVSKCCKGRLCVLVCTVHIPLNELMIYLESESMFGSKQVSPPPRDLKNICSYMLGFSQGGKEGGRAPSFLRQNIFDVVIKTHKCALISKPPLPLFNFFFWLEP